MNRQHMIERRGLLKLRLIKEAQAIQAQLGAASAFAKVLSQDSTFTPSRPGKDAHRSLALTHALAGDAIDRMDSLILEIEELTSAINPDPPQEAAIEPI